MCNSSLSTQKVSQKSGYLPLWNKNFTGSFPSFLLSMNEEKFPFNFVLF